MAKRQPQVKWSLNHAAIEFKSTIETIRKGLRSQDVPVKPTYSTLEVHHALSGDLKAARTRETLANAIKGERENKVAEGELVSMEQVQKLYTDAILPIRQQLLALPSAVASRCNPTDPKFAMDALRQFVDEMLPLIRKELPK